MNDVAEVERPVLLPPADDPVLRARRTLYDDPSLGAGNFLFKSISVSATTAQPFLFLETPFRDSDGELHQAFSLDSLLRAVRAMARWYLSHGVGSNHYVCTYLGNGVAQFVHYLALNSLGAVPVLVNCRMPPSIAAQYACENGFGVFVVDSATAPNGVADLLPEDIVRLVAADAPEGLPALPALPVGWPVERKDEDTVMISHSSGTTAIPKATIFQHRQFFTGKRERLLQFQEGPGDRMLVGMPPSHSAGISYLMTAVMLQLPTYVLTELVGPQVAERIRQFEPTIMTGFPQTWISLTHSEDPPGAFPFLRRFYNTGDSAHEAHVARLLELAPNARFTDGFGASELGMALFQKVSTPGAIASLRCVGRPVAFAEVVVVDASGRPVATGEVGYFAIKSPTITPGYYNQPQLTKLCRLGGYWLTGDVGYRTRDGEYFQVDRGVDVVQTPFGSLYSLLAEELLLGIPEVADAAVVGVDRTPMKTHVTVALVVPKAGRQVHASAVLGKLRVMELFDRELPEFCICAAVLAREDALPAGATGKVLKRTLREGFWALLRKYAAGDRSVFADVMWNVPRDQPTLAPELT